MQIRRRDAICLAILSGIIGTQNVNATLKLHKEANISYVSNVEISDDLELDLGSIEIGTYSVDTISVQDVIDISEKLDKAYMVEDYRLNRAITTYKDSLPVINYNTIYEDTGIEVSDVKLGGKTVPNVASNFKAYMDYKAITTPTSKQYKLQQSVNTYTDSQGLRRYNDLYMVAVGTYYTKEVGTLLKVTLDSGNVLNCIVGDIKSDIHTDDLNQHRNGNIVEFIVDTPFLENEARVMGDISYLSGDNFVGKVVGMEVVDSIIIE